MSSYEQMLRQMLLPNEPDNYFSQSSSSNQDIDIMPGQMAPEILADKDIFPDFSNTGPLAKYRQNATFDWKKLKLLVEDEEALLLRKKIFDFARQHPVFQKSMTDSLTVDEQRHVATKRMMLGHQQLFYGVDDVS